MMYAVYTHNVAGVARCYAIKSLRCEHRRSFPRAGVIFDRRRPEETGSGRVRRANQLLETDRRSTLLLLRVNSRATRLFVQHFSLVHSALMLTTSANNPPPSLPLKGKLSRCVLVYYICEGLARIPANLPAGLEDLISSRTDRNTCKLVTKKAFLIMHPTQLFLVTQSRRRARRTASGRDRG